MQFLPPQSPRPALGVGREVSAKGWCVRDVGAVGTYVQLGPQKPSYNCIPEVRSLACLPRSVDVVLDVWHVPSNDANTS